MTTHRTPRLVRLGAARDLTRAVDEGDYAELNHLQALHDPAGRLSATCRPAGRHGRPVRPRPERPDQRPSSKKGVWP